MKDVGQSTLLIDFAHMLHYSTALGEAIRENYHHMMPYLADVVCAFMAEHVPDHPSHKVKSPQPFRPGFYNLPINSTIRDLKTDRLGELMSISGTVTRTSAVRPELNTGAFRCNDCKTLNTNIAQQFKYTEVSQQHRTEPDRLKGHKWLCSIQMLIYLIHSLPFLALYRFSFFFSLSFSRLNVVIPCVRIAIVGLSTLPCRRFKIGNWCASKRTRPKYRLARCRAR